MRECGLAASLHRAFGGDFSPIERDVGTEIAEEHQQDQDDTETEIVHLSPGAYGIGKANQHECECDEIRANHPLTMHIEAVGESGSIRDECG